MVNILSYLIRFVAPLIILIPAPAALAADRVDVDYHCVEGPNAVSLTDCKVLVKLAARNIQKNLRVRLTTRSVTQLPLLFPSLTDDPAKGLNYLYAITSISRARRGGRLQYYIVPPFASTWTLGYSLGVCTRRGKRNRYKELPVHFSTATYTNGIGEDRFTHSLVALIHELGHALGATHFEPGIMQVDALRYVSEQGILPWLDISKMQVQSCSNG